MRIALLTHQWPGVRMGGIGSYVRQSAAALAAAGHEPHVFTLSADRTDVPPGVTLHPTADLAERVRTGRVSADAAAAVNAGGEAVYRLAVASAITEAFRAEHARRPFDVVEAPEVDALGLPLLLDADRDVPVVTHLHCCTAIAHAANGNRVGPEQSLIHTMEFAAIGLSDGLCAATRAVVEATVAQMSADIYDVATVPHPFACGAEPSSPPAGGPAVFVGRIEWLKGCGTIAAALNDVLARHPAATFRFVGPDTSSAPGGGSMRRHILDTLSPAVADRVTFAGELTPTEVRAELAAAAFVVLPSLRENFSLACCEAMAAGRAVVVSGDTGSAEVVGDAGVVVPRGSVADLSAAMDALYRNGPGSLGRRGYDRIRTFCDPIAVSARRVRVYQDAIDRFAAGHRRTLDAASMAILPALARMTAALTGSADRGHSPGLLLEAVCRRIGTGPADVLLYGAGKHTARLLAERHAWERHGHRVVGLIDDHPKFDGNAQHLGLPVRSLAATEAAAAAGEPVPAVVLSTDTYQGQFWDQTAGLRRSGVHVFRLYEGA